MTLAYDKYIEYTRYITKREESLMFILVTAPHEVCGEGMETKAFATREEAYAQMVAEVAVYAADAGTGADGEKSFDEYAAHVSATRAYVLDVCGWVINEVPGAYIPHEASANLYHAIRDAARAYSDESRSDWYDADEDVRQVCWEMEDYLEKPGEEDVRKMVLAKRIESFAQGVVGELSDEVEAHPKASPDAEARWRVYDCEGGDYVAVATRHDQGWTCEFVHGDQAGIAAAAGDTAEAAWKACQARFAG